MALSAPQKSATIRDLIVNDLTIGQVNLVKADLTAAITAVDDWLTTNQASFVAALPQPFRNASSAQQKALLLSLVALRRYGG